MRTRTRRLLLWAGLGLLAVAVLVQLVPYGRDHTNPPVTRDAPWPDGRARELATAACYDNRPTVWPFRALVKRRRPSVRHLGASGRCFLPFPVRYPSAFALGWCDALVVASIE
jgi:hypothetical protein